jgi:hypothetical protein
MTILIFGFSCDHLLDFLKWYQYPISTILLTTWIRTGVIGYSAASALPALIICVIGPRVRSITGEKAFCSTDFGLVRYGRVMQFSIAAISVFYSKCCSRDTHYYLPFIL